MVLFHYHTLGFLFYLHHILNQQLEQQLLIISHKNKTNDLQQMNEELRHYISKNINNQNSELSANSTGKKKVIDIKLNKK